MRAARTLTQSQWPSRATAPLQIFSITFIMSAMVGRYLPQLKMPRLAAYARPNFGALIQWQPLIGAALVGFLGAKCSHVYCANIA